MGLHKSGYKPLYIAFLNKQLIKPFIVWEVVADIILSVI